MVRRLMVVVIAAGVFLSVGVSSAWALTYGVLGWATNSTGSLLSANGTYAMEYIYQKPALAPNSYGHVSSIYVRNSLKGVEVGWWWKVEYPSSGSPQAFTVWMDNISGYHEYFFSSQPTLTKDTSAPFEIVSTGQGSDDWNARVNGVTKFTWANTGFTYGYSAVGSERSTLSDGNRSSWTYVKRRPASGGSYAYWWYATSTESATDPDYDMTLGSIGNSNHWIYCHP